MITAESSLLVITLTAPPQWSQVSISKNTGADKTDKNARLFALINVAMADAGILAWDQKYLYDFWRPVLGILEHDLSMGPAGQGTNNIDNDCDPGWLPLGAPNTNKTGAKNGTPPFPAYPSGHATFGAAALHMTRLLTVTQPLIAMIFLMAWNWCRTNSMESTRTIRGQSGRNMREAFLRNLHK